MSTKQREKKSHGDVYGISSSFAPGKGNNDTAVFVSHNPRMEQRDVFLYANRLTKDHNWTHVIGIGPSVSTGINLAEILAHTTFIGIITDNAAKQALVERYPTRRWLWGGGRSFRIETTADQLECDLLLVAGNVLETVPEPRHLFDLLFGRDEFIVYRKLVLQHKPRTTGAPEANLYWQWTTAELVSYLTGAYNVTVESTHVGSSQPMYSWLVIRGAAVPLPPQQQQREETYNMLGETLVRPLTK
jgi:hypothetical protein